MWLEEPLYRFSVPVLPNTQFVKEVKAANKRQSNGLQKLSQVGLNGGLRRSAVGTTGGSR
jgi:hypothetical protein